MQRPRDLTRAELKSLRLELDALGYSDANLRRAWSDAKNEDIAASIIGFVRQAALGDALTPFDLRVRVTMQRILAARPWTEVQKKWLKRIEEQLTHEIIVDHAQRRTAYQVGDIRGEMAKGLERDPQVEFDPGREEGPARDRRSRVDRPSHPSSCDEHRRSSPVAAPKAVCDSSDARGRSRFLRWSGGHVATERGNGHRQIQKEIPSRVSGGVAGPLPEKNSASVLQTISQWNISQPLT